MRGYWCSALIEYGPRLWTMWTGREEEAINKMRVLLHIGCQILGIEYREMKSPKCLLTALDGAEGI